MLQMCPENYNLHWQLYSFLKDLQQNRSVKKCIYIAALARDPSLQNLGYIISIPSLWLAYYLEKIVFPSGSLTLRLSLFLNWHCCDLCNVELLDISYCCYLCSSVFLELLAGLWFVQLCILRNIGMIVICVALYS